jgi:hypothetical protein
VTVFYWNNAALGVPPGLPIEVIHKANTEPSMYHLMNLPEDALVACTESGYQASQSPSVASAENELCCLRRQQQTKNTPAAQGPRRSAQGCD